MVPIDAPDALLKTLPPLDRLVRGSLIRSVHDHCRCHPHGRYVYWYLSVNHGGRTRMHKLQDHQIPLVRQALKDYDRWWKTCLKIFEANTQVLLSKEA